MISTWPGRAAAIVIAFMMLAAPVRAEQADDVIDAVVRLYAKVRPEARLAETLGTERAGSGVVIDGNGLVLTIGYLILEASEVAVSGEDGVSVPADVVAYDHDTGLGLVRARGELGVVPMRLGDSADVRAGQHVLVINRLNEASVGVGQVVNRRDFAGPWEYLLEDALFVSPMSNHYGGAALIGEDGSLLGIGSLAVSAAAEGKPIIAGNMFVPVDALKDILADLLTDGRAATRRPWLGLYTGEVQGRLFVTRLAEEGPAEAAGIGVGDIVLGVAGAPVTDMADFYRKVWALGDVGVEVPLDVLQGVEPRRLVVHSSDRYDWLRLDPTD
jgi:S1-C subfamily serine protease